MFKLMISFPQKDDFEQFKLRFQPKEYLLPDSVEVCKVITSLSHLKPLITLFEIDCVLADEILNDFKVKEV